MPAHKVNSKKKQNNLHTSNISIYKILPLILIVAVVPLIVHIKLTQLNAAELFIMPNYDKDQTDMFSFYKMVYFLIFAICGTLVMLLTGKANLLEKDRRSYFLPAAVFAFFTLVSSIASAYQATAFLGFWGRYEGALVLIAYVVVMIIAMNMVKEEKQITILFLSLFGSAAVISIIGVLQLMKIDFFNSQIITYLIVPSALRNSGGHIAAAFPSGTLFSTLYNPNYVGSYMAMLIPVIIVFIIYLKKIYQKLILAGLLCLAILNWIGCESRAGLVGGIAAIFILLIMFRKHIFKYKVVALAVIILLCAAAAAFNFATNGSVVKRLEKLATLESKADIADNLKALDKSLDGLVDVSVDTGKARIVTDKGTLQLIVTENRFDIADENNDPVQSSMSNNAVNFLDERFSKIKLNVLSQEGKVNVIYNDYDLMSLLLTQEGLKCGSNRWMSLRGNKVIESFGSKRFESFGSNRGYIWSRTIPLLKNTILLGHGPDTFPIYFPQYDFLGKLKNYQNGSIFVDKAHNMYLQTALNTGIISLLALLALFGIYFISSIRIYFREKFESFLPYAGLACFTAFCGYAFAGIFNDSVISVAPVFWVLLGLGIGINLKLANKDLLKRSKI